MARKILLADDSVTAQNMGRRILTDAGYEVITVNNGSAALKKITEQKLDLIVLDVYMPGYGGLEVCQRIKETRETARIPVLLTVGKLEPFKPEEARRARADAFIVKPFEASELLTALTKLEDKIVPQAPPQKASRFAKTLAEMERSARENGEVYGDRETGWKDRLSIPAATAKSGEAEVGLQPPADSSVRERRTEEAPKATAPPQEFEHPIPAGLPQDITPEEIAAISAAVATFGGNTPQPAEETAATEEAKSEVAARATEASEAVPAAAPQETVAATQESQPAEAVASSEIPKTIETAAAKTPAEADAGAKPTSEVAAAEAEKPLATDAEVLAAIASLTPVSADGESLRQRDAKAGLQSGEETAAGAVSAVANAVVAAESQATGPRWIAEPVPIGEEESTLILEREMEKACAALAADGTARTGAVPVADSVTNVVASAPVVSAEVIPPVQEQAAVASAISPLKEDAYAAAASAGRSREPANKTETRSSAAASPVSSESPPPAPGGNGQEADLAAAWASWQVRESVAGSQLASRIADAAAAGLKEAQPERSSRSKPEAVTEPKSEPASAAPSEATVIASIVDSMLAELKPKLMEEIARKLGGKK